MQSDIVIERFLHAESEIWFGILKTLLGREPTVDDFKECHKFAIPSENWYELSYKGIKLGTISWDIVTTGGEYKCNMLFTPGQGVLNDNRNV